MTPPVTVAGPALPTSDLVGFDALTIPANRHCAGGAWHDAFALGKGRFVVSVGTVAAGATDAGAAIRAVRDTFAVHPPAAGSTTLLRALDAVLRRQAPSANGVATAIVGIVDCVARTFSYVSAGHPPPFVRYRDGSVAALPADGVPIGLAESDHPPAQVVVDLSGAALLLLYSGALVHTTGAGDAGVGRLRDVLADERIAHCTTPAAWTASRMLDGGSPDGVALLALTFGPGRSASSGLAGERPLWKVSWSFDSTAATANGARRAFLACLTSKNNGGKAIDLAAAELIFGELLGNVVRHAPGPVEIELDWTGEFPVLHVLDSGPGFRSRRKRERLPVDDLSECGRGLFIVNACAAEFSVRNRNGRGTHASATLKVA